MSSIFLEECSFLHFESYTNDFAFCQHATVSFGPYGSEHVHKLLSVSDDTSHTKQQKWCQPAYVARPVKTAADGENSGSMSLCDGHLWGSAEWQLFLSVRPVVMQSASDKENDLEGGLVHKM